MGTLLKLTTDEQVTLKQEFLQHLGVAAGDEMEVFKMPGGVLAIRARHQGDETKSFRDFAGIFASQTAVRLDDDALQQAIEQAAATAASRGLNDEQDHD